MLGDERNPDAGIRLYNVEDNLCTDVLQQVLNVVAYERIVIDGAPAPKDMRVLLLCINLVSTATTLVSVGLQKLICLSANWVS